MINELSLLKSKLKKVYLKMTSKLGGAYLKVSTLQKKINLKNIITKYFPIILQKIRLT